MENFFSFYLDNGRVPVITDTKKPWAYKGHLLYYLQMCQNLGVSQTGFPDRWGYFLDGCREEIPTIQFLSVFQASAARNCVNMLNKLLRASERRFSQWEAFSKLTKWIAYGLGVSTSDEEQDALSITEDVQEAWYRGMDVSKFLYVPADYFGHIICENMSTGWNPHAFFPTPDTVVRAMTEMAMHDIGQKGKECTVLDPCVGTGRMLLHAGNYSLHLYGADIDPLMVRCTRINGAIYTPWLSFNVDKLRAATTFTAPSRRLVLFEPLRCEEGESLFSESAQRVRLRMKAGEYSLSLFNEG